MTLTNGDASGSSAPFLGSQPPLDCTKALEILEKEYPEKDGLDVYTLLDSTKNGALTYNDFLVMPGYISMDARLHLIDIHLTTVSQVSPRQRSPLIHP
jgi:IMP dehydrogenase